MGEQCEREGGKKAFSSGVPLSFVIANLYFKSFYFLAFEKAYCSIFALLVGWCHLEVAIGCTVNCGKSDAIIYRVLEFMVIIN